jgi:predicted DNA-binding transcriptional regulator AlpA
MPTRPDRLRTRDAAQVLGLAERTLERMRQRGDGPPFTRLSRRLVVYDAADLLAWLHARRVEPHEALRA